MRNGPEMMLKALHLGVLLLLFDLESHQHHHRDEEGCERRRQDGGGGGGGGGIGDRGRSVNHFTLQYLVECYILVGHHIAGYNLTAVV